MANGSPDLATWIAQNLAAIIVAVIGAVGSVVAAIISLRSSKGQPGYPVTQVLGLDELIKSAVSESNQQILTELAKLSGEFAKFSARASTNNEALSEEDRSRAETRTSATFKIAAKQLEKTTRAENFPLLVRLVSAWGIGILLVYALSVFNYPVFALVGFDGQIALVLAFATQFGAIVAIGNWLRLRQDQDRRWIVFMAVALVCTLSMTVITAARAQMFLEAIDVPGILRPAFAIVFAMAVPLASWVTGSITSSAADALSSPSQILRWAAEHREAIVGAVAGHEAELWLDNIQLARDEIRAIKGHGDNARVGSKREQIRLQLLELWTKKLRKFYPMATHGILPPDILIGEPSPQADRPR